MKTIHLVDEPNLKFYLIGLKEDTEKNLEEEYPKLFIKVRELVKQINEDLCISIWNLSVMFWYSYHTGIGFGDIEIQAGSEKDLLYVKKYTKDKVIALFSSLNLTISYGRPNFED